jgi:4'-phosphopantetheinyl transferase
MEPPPKQYLVRIEVVLPRNYRGTAHDVLNAGDDEIHLWLAFPDQIRDQHLLVEYENLLADHERAKRARFHFAADRHRYLVTRVLVRTVLSRYVSVDPRDWIFATNEFGRPYVANLSPETSRLSFNVSHTNGLILMGVTTGNALGVDVENVGVRELYTGIADRYFSPSEVADLHSLPKPQQHKRFFDIWTLKESYIKARGMGLAIPLDGFSFRFPSERSIAFSIQASLGDNAARWQFWQFYPEPEFGAAVCAERVIRSRPPLRLTVTVPLDKDSLRNCTPARETGSCRHGQE